MIVHAAADQPMAVADPFTGAGAYVPSASVSTPISYSTNPDPFTGGGAYVPDEPMANPSRPTVPFPPGLSFTPHQHYQGFETVPDGNKVLTKLRDLAPAVEGVNALTPAELAQGGPLEDIVAVCSATYVFRSVPEEPTALCCISVEMYISDVCATVHCLLFAHTICNHMLDGQWQ